MTETYQGATGPREPVVALVHGEWSDGSSWAEVIARLHESGLRVVAVQCGLRSLAEDVAAVERAIRRLGSPIVLVGHSWGGTVVTQAGRAPGVIALVYVAAFAPDVGQSTSDLQASDPPPGHLSLLEVDSGGYLWFPEQHLPHWLAQDLPSANANVLAAVQKPISASALDERVSHAAWRERPAWYLVAAEDRIISPRLQHDMAGRMHAVTRVVAASHVPFASAPRETTVIILDAVRAGRAR